MLITHPEPTHPPSPSVPGPTKFAEPRTDPDYPPYPGDPRPYPNPPWPSGPPTVVRFGRGPSGWPTDPMPTPSNPVPQPGPQPNPRGLVWAGFGVTAALVVGAGLWSWFHAGPLAGVLIGATAVMVGLSRTKRPARPARAGSGKRVTNSGAPRRRIALGHLPG